MPRLTKDFYLRDDVVNLSRELLGKLLCTNIDGLYTSALITETEAYAGETDRASHAYGGRRTNRTEVMYAEGGTAYVYLCYGIHHLFNIVTGKKNTPHAILIRAVKPVDGIEIMLRRRNKFKVDKTLSGGPGTVAQALGITTAHTGVSLLGKTIWLQDEGIVVPKKKIRTGPRIGIDYAGEDAKRPYRFVADL